MPEQARAALKTTTRVLVRELGGFEAAAAACKRSLSHIHRYADPHEADRFIPVDVLADLEAHARTPHVTAALARAAGYLLVRQARPGNCALRSVAETLRTTGTLVANAATALADGHISPAERVSLLAALEAAASAIATTHATLAQGAFEAAPEDLHVVP